MAWWRPAGGAAASKMVVLRRDGLEVRPVGPDEAQSCAEIYLDRRRERFHWLDPASLRLDDFALGVQGEEVWVAMAGAEVAGFSSMYVSVSFVHNLFVRADWEGRGVGRLLMEHAAARLAPPVTLKCVAVNAPARAFYEHLGFRALRRGMSNGVEYVLYQAPPGFGGAPDPGR